MSSSVIKYPGKWLDIANEITWSEYIDDSYKLAYYNPVAKILMLSYNLKADTPNSSTVLTFPSYMKGRPVYNAVCTDVNADVPIAGETPVHNHSMRVYQIVKGDRTGIMTSHSVNYSTPLSHVFSYSIPILP